MTPMRTFAPRPAARLRALALATILAPASLAGQERLVGKWTVSSGVFYDNWSLPVALPTTTLSGGTSFVSGAAQLTLPVAVVVPIFEGWTLDAYSARVRGHVRTTTENGTRGTLRLDGMTDTKLRVVGQLMGDRLLVTAGLTAPTGATRLANDQLDALGVLAAPALRFRSPVLGAGAGATLGLIATRELAGWGMALGTSYEARGSYAPADAAQAGVVASDLRPGNAAHVSLAGERVMGSVRHTLSAAADLYQAGELRTQDAASPNSSLGLGPSVTGTYQLDASHDRIESSSFVVARRRGAYKLDGETVAGSARTEVEAGVQLLRPLAPARALRLAFEGRAHSTGATVTGDGTANVGFASAGVRMLGVTAALRFGTAQAGWTIEPFARAQAGSLDFTSTTRSVTGLSGGLTVTTRL